LFPQMKPLNNNSRLTNTMQKGSIFQQNGRWYLQYRRPVVVDGQIKMRPTKAALGPATGREGITRRQAEQIAADILSRINSIVATASARGHNLVTSDSPTFAELVDSYLQARVGELHPGGLEHYRYVLTRFVVPKLGAAPASNVTPPLIQTLLRELADEGYSHQTVLHVKNAISALFRWAVQYGLATSNPAHQTRAVGRRTEPQRPMTVEECRRLLSYLEGDARQIVEFLLLTGLRVGECLGLQRGDYNPGPDTRIIDGHIVPPGCIIVRRAWGRYGYVPTKTKRSVRVVPLTPRAEAIIRSRLEGTGLSPDQPVWVGPRGAIIDPHNFARRVLKPAAREAGLGWVHWHTLRHTAATLAELDAVERQRVLGHTIMATTVRYSAPVADRVREGLLAIERAVTEDEDGFDPCI